MWQVWRVGLMVEGQFGSSIPRGEKEIRAMLEHRMPAKKPEDGMPLDGLVAQVVSEVAVADEDDGEFVPGWITFKRDEKGLYAEGRTIRGHLKDCALQVAKLFDGTKAHKDKGYPEIKNFRSKFVNRIYVADQKIHLSKEEPDGYEERFIQVMTPQGPRSSIKYVDYVIDPLLEFSVKILDDGVITVKQLSTVLEYGAVHGMGAERSQGWGRYEVLSLDQVG